MDNSQKCICKKKKNLVMGKRGGAILGNQGKVGLLINRYGSSPSLKIWAEFVIADDACIRF
ncbi:hypothetical protein T12_3916 [Trichinella patagoniensis]|uniref:Uncharacterized protein n=1 Tax=Trichinella patagoniensis TaxID=990121 RepID=A0A0V0ZFV9_9BILA|nr:hypothetical protein T12_3916 [Trichinella patagoniensis]